jgi:hypothetical protein
MTLSPTYTRRPVPADATVPTVSAVPAVLVYLGAPPDGSAPSADLAALARAVERLVHSLAPDVVTRVTVAAPPVPQALPARAGRRTGTSRPTRRRRAAPGWRTGCGSTAAAGRWTSAGAGCR